MTDLSRAGERRIVTFRDEQGRSRISRDDKAPRVLELVETPGMRASILWSTTEPPRLDQAVSDPAPALQSCHPVPGGSVFMTLTVPPSSVYQSPDFDPQKAAAEQLQALPGIVERMEPDAPGFHTTDSLDYVVVLSGELWLVVDHEEVRLLPGDVVVQNGTRHAWENRSEQAATFAVVLLGGSRR